MKTVEDTGFAAGKDTLFSPQPSLLTKSQEGMCMLWGAASGFSSGCK
jgi:hypothetical protein